jgi:hypothetical protein
MTDYKRPPSEEKYIRGGSWAWTHPARMVQDESPDREKLIPVEPTPIMRTVWRLRG